MRNPYNNPQTDNRLNEDKVATAFWEIQIDKHDAEIDAVTSNFVKFSGNMPDSKRLLATLVELYAKQCGVKITYEIVDSETSEVHKGDSEQNSVFGFNGIRNR